MILAIRPHLFEFQVFSIKFNVMPTILRINGFRFFFYSNENDEPAHIHVEKGDAEGKIWLEPVIAVAYLVGFTRAEESDVMKIVNTHFEKFINQWYEYFSK
jgi:Domain of unknown function (DUF4160)